MDVTFLPAKLHGAAQAPASKSEAHRRMICAGLSSSPVDLSGFMVSADMEATARCLRTLGTNLRFEGGTLRLQGHKPPRIPAPVYDCGESGSTLRFFVPIALALTGGGVFRMHGRLSKRPMDVYRDLFVPSGVLWRMDEGADGAAELTVKGRIWPGHFVLPGHVSSQFVSGLLFALPLLEADSTLTVLPPVESAGYIAMTVKAIEESGVRLMDNGDFSWKVPGQQSYCAPSGPLHGDWSQAAVLLCAGALGQDITVRGLQTNSVQGDSAVLEHLKALGADISVTEAGISARRGQPHGAVLDLHDCPDIAPMLALVCQMAPGESRLTRCGRLRLKECDRLAATANMLNALGGNCRIEGDDLVITGVSALHGGEVAVENDHRMVMLASIAALCAAEGVAIHGAEALNKSWPEYLAVYRSLGGQTE